MFTREGPETEEEMGVGTREFFGKVVAFRTKSKEYRTVFSVLLISLLAGAPASVRGAGAGDQVTPGAPNVIGDYVPEGLWVPGEGGYVRTNPLQAVRSAEFAGEQAFGALSGTAAPAPASGVRWLGAPGGLAPGSYKESFTEGQGIVGQGPSRFVAIGQKLETVEEGGLPRRGAATRLNGCAGQRSRRSSDHRLHSTYTHG